MVIHIGSIKGGVGKSTIATNLAVWLSLKGENVLLVDADDQLSATNFTEMRSETLGDSGYTIINLYNKSIREQIPKLKENYNYVIIDTGGRDTTSQRAAMTIADKTIVPVVPRAYDIWTVPQIVDLVSEIKTIRDWDVYTFNNMADTSSQENRDLNEALEGLAEQGIHFIPHMIKRRKVVPTKTLEGLSVFEGEKLDEKAVIEFEELFNFIISK